MPPRIVEIPSTGPVRPELLEPAAAALADGQIVAFPTETVYGLGVNAEDAAAVARLRDLKGERGDKPFMILIPDPEHAFRHAGLPPAPAMRLMRIAWPGPLTLVLPGRGGAPEVGLRCPDHPVARELLRAVRFPVASSSANRSAAPPATAAAEVRDALGDAVAVILDGGPTPLRLSSTVARVCEGGAIELLREGSFPVERLLAEAVRQVLFVCTGNICRSPLAAALLRRRLAQSLGVPEEELPRKGFRVLSAGTAALPGQPASEGARSAIRERGGDLAAHSSTPVTPTLVEESDRILAMTGAQKDLLQEWVPGCADRLSVLDPAGDIPDPFGGNLLEYRRCAGAIESRVEALAAELLAGPGLAAPGGSRA